METNTSSGPFSRAIRRLGGEEIILLAFVVVVLLLLTLSPLGFDRAIRPHRQYIESVVQPTRETVRDLESRLTEDVAISRAYLVTRDEDLLEDYRRVQNEQQVSLERLRNRAAELEEPEIREQIRTLESLVIRRREPVDELRRGEITPEEFIGRLSARQALPSTTAATAQRVAEDLIRLERAERERIRTLRRYQGWTLTALALLAVLAVLATGLVAVRLRRRTREEAALGRIARAMNAAVGVDQIARRVADDARSLLGVDAVIVESADSEREEVEIAAASGQAAELPRARMRYPGALLPAQVEEGGARQFARVENEEAPTCSYLSRQFSGHSGAVFPLMSDRGAMGSVVGLREPGRPALSESEMRRGEVLADLAALAIRKIFLLERSQLGWERAEHLLATRSELIRGLSHDLRNPLGAILGYVQLLDAGVQGDLTEDQRNYIHRIQKAGQAMDRTIRHLVEVGRSDAVEVPINPERVAIQQLVREVAEEHQGEAERLGLALMVETPQDLPTIESDPVHIRTILGNLLSNAVKYTSHGTIEVRVGTRSDPGATGPVRGISVEVRDTGPGIAPEEQEAVFKEFSRLHPDRAPGEGIGLASSRRMARRLGGELELESTPGKGSTFVLSLPMRTDGGSPPPQGSSQ